jgi:hypothetical protein
MSLTKFRISLNASMGHSKSKDNEYHIVHPIDMTMNLTIQKQQQEPKEALMKMDVKFSNPLIIMLNKDQKNYLIKFNQLMANLDIIQDNYHFRPEVPVKKVPTSLYKRTVLSGGSTRSRPSSRNKRSSSWTSTSLVHASC